MNFLVGWCLLFMSEENAFWMLVTLVEDFCVGYYSKTMTGARVSANVQTKQSDVGGHKGFGRPTGNRAPKTVQTLWRELCQVFELLSVDTLQASRCFAQSGFSVYL